MSKPAGRTKIKSEVREKTRPEQGRRLGLFEKFNLPAPVASPQQSRIDQIRIAETIVTERTPTQGNKPDVTTPSQLQQRAQVPQPQTHRGPVASAKRPAPKKKKQSHASAILLICLLGLIGYEIGAWRDMKKPKEPVIDEEAIRAAEAALKDRVQLHRTLTGSKLNRDRISVEVENQVTAPPPSQLKPVHAPDMMSGVPLVAEPVQNSSYRDRLQASNPDFADSRIMYTLQEQQAANDWEEAARQQYINEFIANAARAGYKVKVDKNGIVTVIGRTGAAEAGVLPPFKGGSGSAR